MSHIGAPIPTTLTTAANAWPATTSARDARVWDETPIPCPGCDGRLDASQLVDERCRC